MSVIRKASMAVLLAAVGLVLLTGCEESQTTVKSETAPVPLAEGPPKPPPVSTPAGQVASAFEEGVLVEVGGKPIDIEIGHLVPSVADWNADGKKDLVVGQFKSGAISVYLNQGTKEAPQFDNFTVLEAGGKPIRLDAG